MRLVALQSGSAGNCLYVEAGPVRLLIDAGISGVQAQRRLAALGVDICSVDALLITHDHSDHVASAGILHRRYGLPLHLTRATHDASAHRLGGLRRASHFRAGDALRFGGVTVETIPTPHDAADGVAFIVDDGISRLGIFTDLGHCFDGLRVLETCDGALVESNFDPAMLASGPYPPALQRRIAGPGGHLSNHEAAELLARHGRRLRWACLGHISGDNNTPQLALATCRAAVGDGLPLSTTDRAAASAPLEL